jgi:flagellar basal body-associated protein FliL
LKSVASAEKYVVTDKQQPLTWKKKLQYITLFVGVAILLVILVVIAVITSGSIKEDDTGTSGCLSVTTYFSAEATLFNCCKGNVKKEMYVRYTYI